MNRGGSFQPAAAKGEGRREREGREHHVRAYEAEGGFS